MILNLLKEYNSYYAFLYGKYCLENGIEQEKGVLELKKLVDENLDKEASKLLGKYYLDRGNIEGEKYLYFGDREEFFKYIFQKDNREEFEYYLKPFTQELSQRDGFGLGLSIVKKILDKHNFQLLYSYENHYNIFKIVL